MKKLIFIFLILIVSCQDKNKYTLFQEENVFCGFWEINLIDSLKGAGTIIVKENGSIHNGLVVRIYESNCIIYIYGNVDQNGRLDAEFYNDSTYGEFNGVFSDSTAEGFYFFSMNNIIIYQGNWTGVKL